MVNGLRGYRTARLLVAAGGNCQEQVLQSFRKSSYWSQKRLRRLRSFRFCFPIDFADETVAFLLANRKEKD